MSGSLQTWYSAARLDAFADRGTVLRETLELDRLARLCGLLASNVGNVEAELEFASRRTGWVPGELRFETRLVLTCQRCLEPLELRLEERVALAFVESATMEERLPEDRIAVVLEDERWSPAELLEDELIVSLPLVPRHESTMQCGSLAYDEARSDVSGGAAAQDFMPPTNH